MMKNVLGITIVTLLCFVILVAPSGVQASIFEGPTESEFQTLNPLNSGSLAGELDTPGEIVSRVLLFAFPLAGLILFFMLVWGGFEMIKDATSKGMEAGRQRVTAAIVGFLLLFTSYWIIQIVEYVFGVVIL